MGGGGDGLEEETNVKTAEACVCVCACVCVGGCHYHVNKRQMHSLQFCTFFSRNKQDYEPVCVGTGLFVWFSLNSTVRKCPTITSSFVLTVPPSPL